MKFKAEARFGCNRRIIFGKFLREGDVFNFEDNYSVGSFRIQNRSDHDGLTFFQQSLPVSKMLLHDCPFSLGDVFRK